MNQPFSGVAAIRAAMMVMGSTYVTYAIGLLTSVLVARSLGPDDFGRYSYVVWLAGMLIAFGNNGLTTTAIRFVSESLGRRAEEDARRVHGWLRRRQLACLAAVAVAVVALTPFIEPAGWEGHRGAFLIVVLAAGIAKAMFLFDVSVAKGHGLFGVEAKSTVVLSLFNIVAVLALLWIDAPLMAYMALFACIGIGYAIASAMMLRTARISAAREAPADDLLVRLRRHLFWTVVLTVALAFSNKSIETYLLNALVGPAEVGYFAIAGALTRGGIDLLSSGLTTVLMPMMAHAFGEGGIARSNAIMAGAVRYFMFIGLLLAGSGALVADLAVAIMYGEKYAPVVGLLRIMIVVGGLTLAEGAFTALLATTDNQRLRATFAVVSIGVTALFAIALIPTYGLMGAVVAHACSRLIVFTGIGAGILWRMRVQMPWGALVRLFASAAIAAAAAALPLLVVQGVWIEALAAVIYALVFVGATVALSAWRANDIVNIAAFARRYPRVGDRVAPLLERWAGRLERREAP